MKNKEQKTEEEKKQPNKKDSGEKGLSGTLAAILLFSILSIIGALMIFLPEMKFIYFVYIVSGIFIGYGALLTVKYFFQKGYLRATDYSFSAGVLIFALGVCTAVRAEETAKIASMYLGIMVLVAGVITMQHAISLFSISGGFKVPDLILSMIMVLVAVVIILNPKDFMSEYETALYITVFVIGLVGALSQVIVALSLKKYHKIEEEKAAQNVFDAENVRDVTANAIETSDTDNAVLEDKSGDITE